VENTTSKDQLKATSQGFYELFNQSKVPLFQNKVFVSEDEAKKSPVGEVKLVQSKATGFVYNFLFDDSIMNYDENYHNEQSNSGYFMSHQQNVFNLIDSFGLHGKKIVEIGCGKAHFFNIVKKMGYDIIGFDPAYEGDDKNIVKDYFSEKYSIEGDVIILRHTLEHIANPHTFLKEIAKANNYKGYIFIEVPTFDWILKKRAFWDIFYEHCNYFTEKTLGFMFNEAKTGELFNGQYIFCYAKLSDLKDKLTSTNIDKIDALNFLDTLSKWKLKVESGTNTCIWGAGAKGSTFVNLIDPLKQKIRAVIDINPEKQNKYIAVTGHPIYKPEMLLELNCDTLIVMNENYLSEIKDQLRELNIKINNIISL